MWGLHKVRTLWRLAQRKTKDQELRQDIEIFSQTFTRVMDCKDSAIEVAAGLAGWGGVPGDTHDPPPKTPQALVRELEEAEEQQNRALRSHLHLTDQLLQLQRCRLGYLEEGFSAQVGALKAEFEAERCGISRGEGEWGSSGTRGLSWGGVEPLLAPLGSPQRLCQGGNPFALPCVPTERPFWSSKTGKAAACRTWRWPRSRITPGMTTRPC